MRFLLAFAFLASSAFAQWSGSAYGSLNNWRDIGYEGSIGEQEAAWALGADVEYQNRYVRVGLDVDWSPATKQAVKTAWSMTGSATVALRPTEWLYALAGEGYSYTHTDVWRKDAFRPFLGGGVEFDAPWSAGHWRLQATHTFAGSDVSNHLVGESYTWRNDIPLQVGPFHPRVSINYSRWRFHASNQPNGTQYKGRTAGMTIGASW